MSESVAPKQRCPNCAELVVPLPIVYGYPSPELFEEAAAGRVRIGGCVISGDDPEYECPMCHEVITGIEAAGPVVDERSSAAS
ncbi:MAG: hypothetical protein AB1Z66_15585 [Candidatus Limnocylindrales bacterium]